MFDAIGQMPHRQTVFVVFVLFVFGSSAAQIASEFADGETVVSMADDVFRFTLSAMVLAVFIFEYLVQQKHLGNCGGNSKRHVDGLLSSTPNHRSSPVSTAP